jgi:pyruvate carboxylase
MKTSMVAVTRSDDSSTPMNRTIEKKSKVWDYFKQVFVNGILKAECLYNNCKIHLSMPNMSTTSLRRHLHQVHQLNEFKTCKKDLHKNRKKKLPPQVKKQLDQLLIEAVVRDARSFTDFDKPGMKKFFKYALPGKQML